MNLPALILHDAIRELAARWRGASVPLSDVRRALPHVPRSALDAALLRLEDVGAAELRPGNARDAAAREDGIVRVRWDGWEEVLSFVRL